MSSLFQHFTFGFQQLSKLFHDFTTDSYQIQTYAKNPTTVFQATAQSISACPLVCNRCSAYFSSLPWVFIYFFHFQDWCSSVFSSVLCLINFHHCVFVFHFLCSSIFILFITCFLFGIVFTWSLLWYIVSSMLIICNCFIFRFHHISYIYILLPLPKYFVSKRSENSLKKWTISAKNNVCYAYCVFYFVSAPCHGTTLHPATNGG